jgi:hypothetical protein
MQIEIHRSMCNFFRITNRNSIWVHRVVLIPMYTNVEQVFENLSSATTLSDKWWNRLSTEWKELVSRTNGSICLVFLDRTTLRRGVFCFFFRETKKEKRMIIGRGSEVWKISRSKILRGDLFDFTRITVRSSLSSSGNRKQNHRRKELRTLCSEPYNRS